MTKQLEIYGCPLCGNVVEIVRQGVGQLICCGQPMILYKENAFAAVKEMHRPVVTRIEGGVRVTIGSRPHPMEAKHFIEWIELFADETLARRFLSPGQAPAAEFVTKSERVKVRAYCNLHGLWRN